MGKEIEKLERIKKQELTGMGNTSGNNQISSDNCY